MPNMDGWELLEYVKTDTIFGHIPVVMVTSLDTEEHMTHAAELGASDYFVKPLNDDSLSKAITYLGYKVIGYQSGDLHWQSAQ